jgi:hypothetical protein
VPTPPYTVNLTAPNKTILVNVVKGTCGMAVVDEYRELARFNIAWLTAPEEEVKARESKGQGKRPPGEGEPPPPPQQQQPRQEQELAAEAGGGGEDKEEAAAGVAAAAAPATDA